MISLSFADIKGETFEETKQGIKHVLEKLYRIHRYVKDTKSMDEKDMEFFDSVSSRMPDDVAVLALKYLSDYLEAYYGQKVLILLDEYDTPLQEAYVYGYWKELVGFIRRMFNSAFKTNPYMERAVLTGITRVSKESIFSDLNNLTVVTTTSEKYCTQFGFTEEEVFQALDLMGMPECKKDVKEWYDGFTFGSQRDVYNPWSITNFLEEKELKPYWANSSSNSLAGRLIQEGSAWVKQAFEDLMRGNCLETEIVDEQIVYGQLTQKRDAVWSLLLASGYLKVVKKELKKNTDRWRYTLSLTNREVSLMFEGLIQDWFAESGGSYNDFIKALLLGDVKAMTVYMNRVAINTFSYFDTGKNPSEEEPERFYHGFVLGLMVDLADRYVLTSNRESGFGRYDVMLEPRNPGDDGIILEFKVQDKSEERELTDTVKAALNQIEKQKYETLLVEKGIPVDRIRKYGFAFSGKKVLIGI